MVMAQMQTISSGRYILLECSICGPVGVWTSTPAQAAYEHATAGHHAQGIKPKEKP